MHSLVILIIFEQILHVHKYSMLCIYIDSQGNLVCNYVSFPILVLMDILISTSLTWFTIKELKELHFNSIAKLSLDCSM